MLRQLPQIVVLTALLSPLAGCSLGGSHSQHQHATYCSEVVGVEDPLFHGYQKTCWRQWNNDAWAATGCPPVASAGSPAAVPPIPMEQGTLPQHHPETVPYPQFVDPVTTGL